MTGFGRALSSRLRGLQMVGGIVTRVSFGVACGSPADKFRVLGDHPLDDCNDVCVDGVDGRQWNGFWWDEQADFSARQGHRVGTPSLEIVHDFDVPGTGRVREDSLSELIPDNLIDLKACRLIRHQRLNALRLEA